MHLGRDGEHLQVERSGPYVPPITLPGIHEIVLTDAARRGLERAIPGLVFRSVMKRRIVRIDWQAWDRASELPPELPGSGEPEDFILEGLHDSEAAEAAGPLWELVPELVREIQTEAGFNPAAYRGQDFVCADATGGSGFVSDRLKEALATLDEGWIEFLPTRSP